MAKISPTTGEEVIESTNTCNAHNRSGKGTCRRPSGWGTDHLGIGRCKLHGGSMPNHRRQAQNEMAKRGVREFGLARNIEPIDALMEELWRTSGLVSFYESRVRELPEEALSGKIGAEGESDTGLTYHARKEANFFIRAHKEEREHLIKVAKTCIDAGIEERRVRIAEAQGAMIATLIRSILVGVGVDPNKPKVRKVVRAELTSIAASGTDTTPGTNGGDK